MEKYNYNQLLAFGFFLYTLGSIATDFGEQQEGYTLGWAHVVTWILLFCSIYYLGYKSKK